MYLKNQHRHPARFPCLLPKHRVPSHINLIWGPWFAWVHPWYGPPCLQQGLTSRRRSSHSSIWCWGGIWVRTMSVRTRTSSLLKQQYKVLGWVPFWVGLTLFGRGQGACIENRWDSGDRWRRWRGTGTPIWKGGWPRGEGWFCWWFLCFRLRVSLPCRQVRRGSWRGWWWFVSRCVDGHF